jgi:hypothetical protein
MSDNVDKNLSDFVKEKGQERAEESASGMVWSVRK